MTELFVKDLEEVKKVKKLGAKYNLKTKRWTIPDDKKELVDDYIKIYLDISFKEKDKVKKLGAKFDSESKRWFICKKQSKIFSQWIENNKRIYLDIPFEFVEDVKK